MINKTIVVFAVIAGACLTLATDASAEKARGGACGADMAKFCKDVKPGGGRIADCLKEHEKDLSKDCVEQRAKASEKRAKKGGKHGKSARGGDQDRQGFKGAWNKGGKGGGGRPDMAQAGGAQPENIGLAIDQAYRTIEEL